MIAALKEHCDTVEECYEFLLAYAAQGARSDQDTPAGRDLRRFLGRFDEVLSGLPDVFRRVVVHERLQPPTRYLAFIAVLERDAHAAQAAVQLVLAQESISSQVIDNLNGSIHVRALLTDVFLLDEILRPGASEDEAPASSTEP